jgi:hypothetical protein
MMRVKRLLFAKHCFPMKVRSVLLLFNCTISFIQIVLSQTTLSLEQGFKNPPVSARPKALWPWVNGNVNLSQVTYELEEAKQKGMGGFDIWDIGAMVDPNKVIPAGPAFLGDESLQAIAYAIHEADRLGLELGLVFSSSWNAGGSWVKPEHGAMGLFRSDTIITGPQTFSSTLPFPLIPDDYNGRRNLSSLFKDPKTGLPVFYKEVAMIAHPYQKDSSITSLQNIYDLKNYSDNTGKIKWDVPAGEWRIIRYVCAPTGQPLADPSPNSNGLMLDHFSAEAQKTNLSYIFQKLLPVTGSLKKSSLKYLVADSYEVNSAVWTPLLPEEFEKKNHYSLIHFLPLLDGFTLNDTNIDDRFRFDFTKTLSDLIIQNHYKLGKEICEQNGIGFCAEAGGPGKPIHNVPFEDLKALGALTVPRGEFWNKHPQQEILQIVKGIASASHIYNQKFVEAESFTSVWLWQEGPDELKPLADRAMCEGLNRFVYHTFPHTPPESGNPGWVYNFGTLINTTNGWWPKSNAFHEYLARCCYLLQQGNFVGDVAFYYGDKAPNFVSPKHINESLGFGYDYDVVNSDAILNKMQVKNGRIYLPHGQFYEVLVLPDETNINLEVLKKLEQMVVAGAIVIGPKPTLSYGLDNYQQYDKQVQSITEKLWGDCDSIHVKEHSYGKGKIVWGKSIREVLSAKNIIPDFQFSNSHSGDTFDYIHRRTEKEEIYFIRNVRREAFNGLVTFRVKDLHPELWNPETGEITNIPFYYAEENQITLPLSLQTNGSCFIVFRSNNKKTETAKNSISSLKNETNIYYSKNETIATTNGEWKWGSIHQTIQLPQPILLTNPWILHFEQQNTGTGRDTMQYLIPLNQSSTDAVKYYSGNVTYITNFVIIKDQMKDNQRLILDLGRVKEIADIILNGKRIGVCWHAPFQIDITEAVRAGENFLQIEVVNTINNRLIGDTKLPEQYRRMKSNITKLPNAWRTPFADAPLLDAGLIGPVQIKFAQVLK